MEQERVKINLHDLDRDKISIRKVFTDNAVEQGWTMDQVDSVFKGTSTFSVNKLLSKLYNYSEPDYRCDDEDDEYWDEDYEPDGGFIEQPYQDNSMSYYN